MLNMLCFFLNYRWTPGWNTTGCCSSSYCVTYYFHRGEAQEEVSVKWSVKFKEFV